ncbi:Radical SAM domain protein [Gracilaria domingensis]|nr:Radical SAM domain protein [Gracilaria domingensis]
MTSLVADRLLHLTENSPSIEVADITGGAPEMHSQFRPLVRAFRKMGISVIDRCNLTVLMREDQSDLVQFLAENQVRVVASLPCYTPENVKKQRGNGVFDESIEALRRLNEAGYGRHPSLKLDLVYNPVGATLPPPQRKLEVDYRRELKRAFDIDFTSLMCITNMPIKRFADDLLAHGRLEQYVNLLVNNFNVQNVENVMCLDMVHVAYDGSFYDCDFNYALDMHLPAPNGSSSVRKTKGLNVFDVDSFAELQSGEIRTGTHCFGCTAGSGSSCGGNLS